MSTSIIDENGNLFKFPHKAYESALRNIIQNHVDGCDYIIECSAGSSKGDNYLGIVYRIDVKDTKDKSVKLSLVLKSAPQNIARREEFHAHAAFERESLFYEQVFPLYKNFQEEKGIDFAKDGFNNVAVCYKILHEEPCEGLFFENLRVKGFDMFNRHNDLTKEHVLLTMRALGKMHSIFYALKDQKPESVQTFRKMEDLFLKFCGEYDSTARIMIETNNKMAISVVKRSKKENMKNRVLEILNRDLMKELREVVQGDLAEPYATLCHGDCWNNNIMYQDDENGIPKEVILLDFQIMRYASPACDLLYYLFGCTSKDLRDKHYEDFLNTYYETLSTFMTRLGSSPEKIFPRQALNDQMKKFGYFGVLMAALVIPFFVSDPEDAPDFDLIATKYKESRETATEFDSSLLEFKSENKRAKYEERLMGAFEDMCNFGYI